MKTPEDEQPAQRSDFEQIQAANLPVVKEGSATPEVQRLYQQFRAEFDRPQVPGILQCFATHPPLLDHMMGLAKSMLFVAGALGRQHKEMISTFVSARNSCEYCADSHAYSFRLNGGSAPALNSVLACDLESLSLKAEERILLRFVKKISENSHTITSADIEAMRLAGWTDLQIAEAIHVTALFACFNRIVNAFGLPSQEMLKLFQQQHQEDGAGHA
ncbi:carboxymuconolactone decarboxylase family protein [Granulicella sp. S190]|uniref:carboxymuconolactone decarboxylase family protein n=1 Tax=Granulicella sp. S190 TaxID=1747226 RepID=UPI00131EA031|nr:peroxidase-related enzyme [Granulicella sp. S190]